MPCAEQNLHKLSVHFYDSVSVPRGAGVPIPAGTILRGGNIADIWHGKVNHLTTRAKPLFMRGGGGPPPCWNRSPGLAIRNGARCSSLFDHFLVTSGLNSQ